MKGNPRLRFEASKGGHAKQAKRAQRVADQTKQLPPLNSIENAQARLEIANRLAMTGVLAGSQAGAAVRAVEVWLRAEEQRVDVQRLAVLEKEVTRLERELKAARGRDA